ncbi:putative Zn-dependent protease YfgC superfamily [Candidatus Termititenax aidoneus]|uniref:Zn-dependent protease YfgC superfamily n=1 Tax=Termititenax aidoneus TaxID=2218524 RepID=A0A388T9Z5_TERA1|nr:putative Zn-dependent protease YfgC superfamily [Candidatus Termititenax aidoneus]
MKKLILAALICSALLLTGCGINPVTGGYTLNFYSDAQEYQMGEEYHPQLVAQYGEYADQNLRNYVQDIVNRLGDVSHRPDLNYRVTLLDTPEINAFAIPGGRVYVCRGLLIYINSEAELAGVMGHEIGHVTAKHSVQQMSKQQGLDFGLLLGAVFLAKDSEQNAQNFLNLGSTVSNLALLSYSREDEMEADRLGVEYAHKAGFSPLGVGQVMKMFERMSGKQSKFNLLLSSHPASETRSKQARIEVSKLAENQDINRELDRGAYLGKIKNIITGHNPERGVVNNGNFYSTRYQLAFNGGGGKFSMDNGYLMAWQNPPQTAAVYLEMLEMNNNPEKTKTTQMEKNLGTTAHTVTGRNWNSSRGNVYIYLAQTKEGYYQVSQYFNIYRGKMLCLTVLEKLTGQQTTLANLDSALQNLRPLSAAEAEQLKPPRLEIYTARAGDTWESLAQTYFSPAEAQKLAWFNGCELTDSLPEKIKLGLF